MNQPLSDVDLLLRRCREVADLLTGRSAGSDGADRAAAKLLAVVPDARLALWRPHGGEPAGTAGPDAPPDCGEALRSDVFRLEAAKGAVHLAPALGAVFGLHCLATLVRDEHGPWAFLALGALPDSPPETVALAETVLTVLPHFLSLGRRCQSSRRECDELAGFALAGQATVGLTHDLNNLFNSMTLQASVVQLQVDAKLHGALDVIRRQANQATGLLRLLSHLPAERAKTFYLVDLVRVVREVLGERPALAGRVAFTPPPTSPPPVRATVSALKQLVYLLLSGLAAGAAGPVRAGAEAQGAGAQLVLEAEGALAADADSLPWGGPASLERFAGQSLLRQLGGVLRLEPRPPDGCRVRVSWS